MNDKQDACWEDFEAENPVHLVWGFIGGDLFRYEVWRILLPWRCWKDYHDQAYSCPLERLASLCILVSLKTLEHHDTMLLRGSKGSLIGTPSCREASPLAQWMQFLPAWPATLIYSANKISLYAPRDSYRSRLSLKSFLYTRQKKIEGIFSQTGHL